MPSELFVTPDGTNRVLYGRTFQCRRFQEAIDVASPGDVVTLLPGVYDEPVTIRGKRGGKGAPITVRSDGTSTLDGRRVPLRPPGLARASDYAFIKVRDCAGIVIENVTMQNVWPTAIYVEDSQYVAIRRLNLNGATYGVFARGETTEHLLLERCSWIQDDRIWDQTLWKDIHAPPLPRRELDGDFFRSKDIAGNVVIRYNFIAQAFNGVHFFADERVRPGRFNRNVWIYRNTFTFIRDNAVEAENSAMNWWVFENKIYNCHTWFAFEQCNGGYVYLFSNRGWFDRKPGPPGDCHSGGAVIKASKVKDRDEDDFLPKHPTYMFNNSWYLRSNYLKKGKLRNFRHFNNAIAYAREEHHTVGVVDRDRRMIGVSGAPDLRCDGPVEPERPFTTDWRRLAISFENDVCDHPHYPASLKADGYPVAGTAASPGFLYAREGDFSLSPDSPCRGTGIAPSLALADGSVWSLKAPLNIGAIGETDGVPLGPFALGCPQSSLPEDYVEDGEA